MTKVYLGNLTHQRFTDIVYWCLEKFGTYGEGWRLDWEKHTVFLDEKNAVLFALRWAE